MVYRIIIWVIAITIAGSVVRYNVASARQQRQFDKVPVELRVPGIPSLEMDILVADSIAYIPIRPFFEYAGIKSVVDASAQRIEGFFRAPDSTYRIDLRENTGKIDDRSVTVSSQDVFFRSDTAYARLGFLNTFFGISSAFNPRRLAITLDPDKLPGIAFQKRHVRLLRAVDRRQVMPEPEIDYPRDLFITGAGRFNWRVNPIYSRSDIYNVPYSVNFGSKFIGGDLTIALQGKVRKNFSTHTIRGQYRIPFPENHVFQQVILGYLNPFPYYFADVIGGEITNRPLGRRRMLAREIFQGQIGPRNDIELSESEGLPFIVSDETGDYQIEMPVSFGLGTISLRASDQYGQTQIISYRYNTPFSMLPPGSVEYSVTMGKLNISPKTFTSANYFNWGINSHLTVGGRLDFFNFPLIPEKLFPSLTAAFRIGQSVAIEALVNPLLSSRVSLSWVFLELGRFSVSETKFGHSNEVNPSKSREETDARVELPLTSGNRPLQFQLSGRMTEFDDYQDRTLQVGINKLFPGFSAGLSSLSSWRRIFESGETKLQTHFLNLFFRIELPRGINLSFSMTDDNVRKQIASIQIFASKNIFRRLTATVSYFVAPNVPSTSIGFQLQYRFPFATTSTTVTRTEFGTSYGFLGSGAVIFDVTKPLLTFENYSGSFSFGGFDVFPFFDANGNNRKDAGEQSIQQARISYQNEAKINRVTMNPKNRFSIRNLNPYDYYVVHLDPQSLEDPQLVPQYSTLRVLAESNYFRRVDIPVVYATTIRGRINAENNQAQFPLGGLKVRLIGSRVGQIKETQTFSTGEYEFALVPSGDYQIQLDPEQLRQLGLRSDPADKRLNVSAGEGSKTIENVDFVVKNP